MKNINHLSLFFSSLFVMSALHYYMSSGLGRGIGLDDDYLDSPPIELQNFSISQSDINGVNAEMYGSSVEQFEHMDVLHDFRVRRLLDGNIENITGKKAVYMYDRYSFPDGVLYVNDGKSISFYSEKGVYNTTDGTFEGSGNFNLSDGVNSSKGSDIKYDSRTGNTSAKNINANLFVNRNE